MPSTRELARRFCVHPNTISAAYRELSARGWVERRKGSGVYVRSLDHRATSANAKLDEIIASFLSELRERGFAPAEIKRGVLRQLDAQPPDHFLVIEPDAELRRILVAEVAAATTFRVRGASFDECADRDIFTGASLLALYGQAERVREALRSAALPATETSLLILRSRSIAESLRAAEPPPADALIAVVSRWPEFLRWSHAILVAAGVDADALSFHDARTSDWRRGLRASAFAIADVLTARQIPANCETRIFHIIADSSLDELRLFARQHLA